MPLPLLAIGAGALLVGTVGTVGTVVYSEKVRGKIRDAVDYVCQKIKAACSAVKQFVFDCVEKAREFAAWVSAGVKATLQYIIDSVKDGVNKVADVTKFVAKKIYDGVNMLISAIQSILTTTYEMGMVGGLACLDILVPLVELYSDVLKEMNMVRLPYQVKSLTFDVKSYSVQWRNETNEKENENNLMKSLMRKKMKGTITDKESIKLEELLEKE